MFGQTAQSNLDMLFVAQGNFSVLQECGKNQRHEYRTPTTEKISGSLAFSASSQRLGVRHLYNCRDLSIPFFFHRGLRRIFLVKPIKRRWPTKMILS
jgi:hypothetical protein